MLFRSRRVGGFSIVALLALLYVSLSIEWSTSKHVTRGLKDKTEGPGHLPDAAASLGNGGRWTIFFAYYSLLIHVLVLVFPLRACCAVDGLTHGVKAVVSNKSLQRLKYSQPRRLSFISLACDETLICQVSATSSEAGDSEMRYSITEIELDQDKVIHAIIIPNYKEDIDGLRETLEVLASHPQARSVYDVSGS